MSIARMMAVAAVATMALSGAALAEGKKDDAMGKGDAMKSEMAKDAAMKKDEMAKDDGEGRHEKVST
jgi:pentapeptide MXKDX repeat protein